MRLWGAPRRRARGTHRSLTYRAGRKVGRAIDDRVPIAKPIRKELKKAFPEHSSFMLGEIALYSFIILVLTGTYLTFFFDPSDAKVKYDGSYTPLKGITMSKAYSSTLKIAFDVRGGLLIRQIHHWAALLFIAAMIVHMCRIFFTGAFRKPREINWLIGLTLMLLGLVEGFAGYSLPDDVLSGTGLRIGYSIVESIPVVGSWLAFLIWDGPYPGHSMLQRLYIAHVLLLPGIILALIGAHLALVIRQKHTDFPGVGRTEDTVAGEPMFPIYAAKAGGFFMITAGVLVALGGLVQINPVWLWGPYEPSIASSNSQPDWFVWFVEGSIRMFPRLGIRTLGHNIPPLFWSAVAVPTVMFGLAYAYPFIERRRMHDYRSHNVLQRPRDNPTRTALGSMAVTAFVVMSLAATDDMIAHVFELPLEWVVWGFRMAVIVLPFGAFFVARSACYRLQQHDRVLLAEGIGTGVVRRRPDGSWAEVTRQVDAIGTGEPEPVPYRVPVRMAQPVRPPQPRSSGRGGHRAAPRRTASSGRGKD